MPKFGRTVVIKISENCKFVTSEYVYYFLIYIMVVAVTFRIGCTLFELSSKPKEKEPLDTKIRPDIKTIIKKIRGGEFLKKLSLSDLVRLKKLLLCLEKSPSSGFALAILDEQTNRLVLRLMSTLLPQKPYSVRGLVKYGGREVVKLVNLVRSRPDKVLFNVIKITPNLLRRLVRMHIRHYTDTTSVSIQYFGLIALVDWLDVEVVFSKAVVTSVFACFTGIMLVLYRYALVSLLTTVSSAATSMVLGFLLIIHLETGVPTCLEYLVPLPALPAIETIKQNENIPKEMPKIKVVLPSSWRIGKKKNDDQVIIASDENQIEIYEDIILDSGGRITMPSGYRKVDNDRITKVNPEDIDKIVEGLDPEYVRNECQKTTKSSTDKPKRSQSGLFAEAAELKAKKRKKRSLAVNERTDTIFTVQKRDQEKLIQMNQNGNDGTRENALGLALLDLIEDHLTISDIDERIQAEQKN